MDQSSGSTQISSTLIRFIVIEIEMVVYIV